MANSSRKSGRKSIRLAKNIKLNFGKTGVSVTLGSGGLKSTIHSSGRITNTVGIPGTGIYKSESIKLGNDKTKKVISGLKRKNLRIVKGSFS